MTPLVLVAAGGLAREVLAALAGHPDHVVRGILDDAPNLQGSLVAGVPVLGPLDHVHEHDDAQLLVCAGSGRSRAAIVDRLRRRGVGDDRFATFIDSSVALPARCVIGSGSILLAHTVLTTDVIVGRHVVAMPSVTLTHDNRVDDFATLCAGVSLGGSVRVGRGAYLGMNSSVREHVTVGAAAVLGMGAALLEDLPEAETWAGVPARRLDRRVGRRHPTNFEVSGV